MTEIDEPIHLSAYDPAWPNLFAAEARRVPGLLAKPIIDIMLGVNFEEGIECSEED